MRNGADSLILSLLNGTEQAYGYRARPFEGEVTEKAMWGIREIQSKLQAGAADGLRLDVSRTGKQAYLHLEGSEWTLTCDRPKTFFDLTHAMMVATGVELIDVHKIWSKIEVLRNRKIAREAAGIGGIP